MRVRILRGLSVVAFLLALFWVYDARNPESLITAIVLLGGVISTFLANPERRTLEGESHSEALGPTGLSGPHPVTPEASKRPATAPTQGLPDSQTLRQSIVVLPFDNLSPDPSDSYFSDGLTEEITSKLSKLSSLRVISRSSAMAFKETQKDVRTIGRELDVLHVLEGSVRKAGTDLRITAQLIDAETDTHLWAETYEGVLDDVFRIQETVAQSIVDALSLTVSHDERERIKDRPIDNVHAYECLLKARQEIWRWTPDGLDRATKHLENGIQIIGDHPDLLFGLGYVQFQFVNTGLKVGDEAEEALGRAEAYAQDIFRIQPDSAQSHCLLGLVEWQRGGYREVTHHLKASLARDPGNLDAIWFLGLVLAQTGKIDAARPLLQEFLKRDPLAPLAHACQGYMELVEGRFALSTPHYRRAFDMDPDDPFLRVLLGYAYVLEGRPDEAQPLFDSVSVPDPTSMLQWIASFYAAALRGDRQRVEELEASEFYSHARRVSVYSLWTAEAYAYLAEAEKALHWLEIAIEKGHLNHPFLSEWNPAFENLRGDPRFVELMARARKGQAEFEA